MTLITPPSLLLILNASLRNSYHILFVIVFSPFLPLLLPLFIFYVSLSPCLSLLHYFSLFVYFLSLFISSPPFSPSPQPGTSGHILVSAHLHIKHSVWMCVCVWVKDRDVSLCESAVALNFHFNQHVGERTILLPQGRTEGPLHNLSVSFLLPRSPSIPPSLSLSLSLSETTN